MATCRSEQELESCVSGTVTSVQVAAWQSPIKTCGSCAARLLQQRDALDDETTPIPRSQSPPSDGPIAAGTRLGDFKIEKHIGSGGIGIVYRARQISLNRRVAINRAEAR